jgi:hypothetical protein
MGLRFRKSLRILPGLRFNLTRRGLSTTLGPPGATVNIGSSGMRGNVGLPGTGLSYSQRLSGLGGGSAGPNQKVGQGGGCAFLAVIGFFILLVSMCSKNDNGPNQPSASSSGTASQSQVLETRYVSAQFLNCRDEPSPSGKKVGLLAQNDTAEVIETSGTWSKLRQASGDCWVASSFLAASPVLVAQSLTSSGISDTLHAGSSGPASRPKARSNAKSSKKRMSSGHYLDGSCPCSGSKVCIGPRGGRYCITSGGNKRYGV